MDKNKMPIFFSCLMSKGRRDWSTPYNEARMDRLREALTLWEVSLERGYIPNARFDESRQVISRAVEDAWNSFYRDSDWICSLDRSAQETLDGMYPNLASIKGRLRRVQKTPDSPLRDELEAFLTEILPLSEAYGFLKKNARKKVINTIPEEEKFTPPPSSSEAVKKVKRALELSIDKAYQGLLDRTKSNNRSIIKKYLDAQSNKMSIPGVEAGYSPREHFTVKLGRSHRRISNQDAVLFLEKVLERTHIPGSALGLRSIYQENSDTYKLSDDIAEKDAKLIRDQFLYKSLVKMTPILEAKGDDLFKSVKEVGSFNLEGMEGEFEVQFRDGSSFKLKNAVVFVVNQFQTHFCRFPTTFHDVIMPDGSPLPNPSEEKMHKVFAAARSTTPAPPGPK